MPTIKGPVEIRILGVDPGFDRIGVAIIEGARGKETLVFSCCIETLRAESHEKRLAHLSLELNKIIKKFNPKVLAIEKLFFNQNRNSALKVAEGRGVILSVASGYGLQAFEYSPQEVKASVTGYGKASKKDIEFIVSKTMKIPVIKSKRLDDEFDAIAVALTHSLKGAVFSYPQK